MQAVVAIVFRNIPHADCVCGKAALLDLLPQRFPIQCAVGLVELLRMVQIIAVILNYDTSQSLCLTFWPEVDKRKCRYIILHRIE